MEKLFGTKSPSLTKRENFADNQLIFYLLQKATIVLLLNKQLYFFNF